MVTIIVLAILIGCIPGAIAQSKGHSFILWWLFGTLLFILALPCALMLSDQRPSQQPPPVVISQSAASAAEEIERFAALRDKGLITADEYEAKRAQLLALPAPALTPAAADAAHFLG